MEKKTNTSKSSTLGGILFFLAGFVGALIVGWIIFPMVLYSKQPQPLNFSHAIHMNPERVEGIEGDTETEKCLFCHEFREDGTFAGIPKLEKCTECHDDPDSPLGETDEEKAFLKTYVGPEKEVPWLSYYRQPDCVYFPHIAHVKMGELECKTCHGDHGKLDQLPPYEANRITGYSRNIWGKRISGYKKHTWDRMKMDDCSECHSKMGHEENNACFVCHK
ncbi:MAG: cytochrome c3 family protein [Deltaproteobacteria bacterium]|nr:cytochrome c3 family protein [Deltaproteobacteria bacterium]MBW1927602.1 cytochrome c3 family protein [Deltaproteobacteria bacterium]MBW2024609.1 cytochrome c3 family protein [Deltaproteobacteria bacterium]MBW2125692.1 cytochrome c3 family protein [Deltaproteobacteria bacterium]